MLIVAVSLFSCNNKKVATELNDFLGSNIVIPPIIKDTIQNQLSEKEYILVLYFEVKDCIPCTLESVNLLKNYQKEFDDDNLGILLIMQDSDKNEKVRLVTETLNIKYPIVFDKDNIFRDENQVIQNPIAQTFIIDSHYKVIWIGSPIQNKESLERFRNMMHLLKQ